MPDRELIRILLVDDEPKVLAAARRQLRGRFAVTVAESGAQCLELIATRGPFAVVSSDLKMPGMDGIELLSQVRRVAPDTVRILLTGQADVHAAIEAVNRGSVFRFLTKPCPPERLLPVLADAAEQHRLVTAERVLLEQTLVGSIRALTDVLALVSPISFGRATRAKKRVGELARHLEVPERWQCEAAAMLSQLGCVTLPATLAEKLYHGRPLDADERQLVSRLPELSEKLLGQIPRLDGVRRILRYQSKCFDGSGPPADAVSGDAIPWGARALKLVLDLDTLEANELDADEALDTLKSREGHYDPELVDAVENMLCAPPSGPIRELHIAELAPGMVLAEDVLSETGLLVLARGLEVTTGLLERLRNFREKVGTSERVRVHLVGGSGAERTRPAAEPAAVAS